MSCGNEWSGPDELSLERDDLCYGYQFLWNFASDKSLRIRLFDELYWDLHNKETLEEQCSENAHCKRWYRAQRKFWKFYEAPSNKEWDWDTIPIPDTFESMIQRRRTGRRNIDGEYADTLDPSSQHPAQEDPEQTPERDFIAALLHEVQCLKERAQVGNGWDAALYRRDLPLGSQTWNYYDQDTMDDKGLDDDDGDNGYAESYEQSNAEDGSDECSTEYYEGGDQGGIDEYTYGYAGGYGYVSAQDKYENDKYPYSNNEETRLPFNTQHIIDSDPEPADTMAISTRCRNTLFLHGTSSILNPRNEGGPHAKQRDLFMIEYLSGAGIILNESNQCGMVCVHIKGSQDARYRARYYLDDYVRNLDQHEAHRKSEGLTQQSDHRDVGEHRSLSRGRTTTRHDDCY